MTTIDQIQQLSAERQALWLKSGHAATDPIRHVGLTSQEQLRLDEINRQLRKLWHAHTDCANPFCPCRRNDNHHSRKPHSHHRGRIRAKSLANI